MLITGTLPCSASSSRTECGPVRTQIACTKRESTSAVSRTDSPRESCSSPSRSTSGCPPSSTTPTSNDTRVRVEGPLEDQCHAAAIERVRREPVLLQLFRAVEQRGQLGARNLLSGEKVASHRRILVI